MLRQSKKNLRPALAAVVALVCSDERLAAANEDDKRVCVAAADQGQLLRDGGKYEDALVQFTGCAEDRCPTIVREQCGVWLGQVMDAMPTVVFAATDAAGNDLIQMRVIADGRPLAEVLDGRPVRLDPGPHEVRFEAPGRPSSVIDVVLRAGDKNRVVTALVGDPLADHRGPAPVARVSRGATGSARAVTALSLLGAGALSIGAGVYFALASQSDADHARALRQDLGRDGCAQGAAPMCVSLSDAVDGQGRDAILSTAFYIAGGALAATASVAWLTWPARPKMNRRVGAISVRPMFGLDRVGMSAQIELP
jgi:hypothetical protein